MTICLSKSKLIAFRQCPKRLWLEVHRKVPIVEDESTKRRFDVGNQLGALARLQYPDGTLIATGRDMALAAKLTQAKLLEKPRKAIFEATFEAAGLRAQVDLLVPVRKGWHMAEVKSSTSVKDYHIEDAAIQTWVVREAGLALESTSLQVIDSKWTYSGGPDYSGLLKMEPVNDAIEPLQKEVPKWAKAARATVGGAEPNVKMGRHCNAPFECVFQEYCSSLAEPVQFPISWLPNLNATKRARLEEAGIADLRDIEPDDLNERQQMIQHATIHNEAFFEPLDAAERKSFAGTRYYLDFETINFTIPIWSDTRPFQKIPFQWSCHIERPDGTLSHEMFLDLSGDDPSRRFAESLVRAVGRAGPVFVYKQSFEKGVISALADRFPDLAVKLNKILPRVVDLLPATRKHYYHPDMKGSWSLKAVLPTIAPELSYENLEEVADGGDAQSAYLEAINADADTGRKRVLENALRAYCFRDTQAMVRLLAFLLSPRL